MFSVTRRLQSATKLKVGVVIPGETKIQCKYSSTMSVEDSVEYTYDIGILVSEDYKHSTPNQGPHQILVDVDIEKLKLDNKNRVKQTFLSALTVPQC